MWSRRYILGKREPVPPRPRWLRPPPLLRSDDAEVVETIRRTGKTANTGNYGPYRTSMIGAYNGGGMRPAEEYSRNAQRQNSAWFNDEMLEFWWKKWGLDDEREAQYRQERKAKNEVTAKRRAERHAEEAEQRTIMLGETAAWNRQQQWLEEQRRMREARWNAEEREWYAWEQERKAAKLHRAVNEYEERKTQRRRQLRQIQSAQRELREIGSHVRNKRYLRHPSENARSVEKAR